MSYTYKTKSSAQLLLFFIRRYPAKFCIVLFSLVIAGLIETLGVGALLPLLNIVLSSPENINAEKAGTIEMFVNHAFDFLGVEQSFNNLLFLIVGTIAMKAFIVFLSLRAVSYIAADITYDLRKNLIHSLMNAEWRYFSELDIGRSSNAIATEADYAGQFCMIMGKALAAGIQVCVYTFIAFSVDWKISVAAIIMGGVLAFILKFLVTMARDAGKNMADVSNSLLSRLNASLSGAKPIKAMGEEDHYVELLNDDTMRLQNARKDLAFSSLLLQNIHEPMLVLIMALGLFWAYGYANYPISELFMMAFLFNRLLSQVNLVQNHYQKSSVFEGAVNAILEKTAIADNQKETNSGTHSPSFEEKIRLNDVALSYAGHQVFNALSLEIPAYKMSVIFGPSGSGKSTILDFILGLNAPDSGEIYIDDMRLSEVDIRAWRKRIGYVPQETFLFHDTIRQNITLGHGDYSDEDVINALKKANAWEFVSRLEDGINHIVGERGGKLSGGQRQRLALARALIRNPKILILDEATSGLDKENEDEIIGLLKGMTDRITVILISHTPAILNQADHIIQLDYRDRNLS